jgi:hypothetical protein
MNLPQTILQAGINCIAINENKQSLFSWKKYQTELISPAELSRQLADPKAKGIAMICGHISGNLEAIDVDTKYQTYDLWSEIQSRIPADLMAKLRIVQTKSGGYHLIYRCEYIEGNQKLAQRPATDEEIKNSPHLKSLVIIETRGEGGYICAPPTEGYAIIQPEINVISVDEREMLFEAMRSFNEVIEEVVVETHQRDTSNDYGLSPYDDYNKRGDVVGLLQKHGWTITNQNSERVFMLRPGGTSIHSGSYNKNMNLFSVFSTNTPFVPQKGYKPYAVFAILECNSDFKLAAKRLFQEGYGERKVNYGTKLENELYEKKTSGASDEELTVLLVKKHEKSIDDAKRIVKDITEKWGPDILEFWDVEIKNGKAVPTINRYKLQVFLTLQGCFRLYFYDSNSTIYRLIRAKDGFVEESSTEQIKKFIKNYVDRLPNNFDKGMTSKDLLELIYTGSNVFFSDSFFEFFDRANLDFLKDDADTCYIPFRNGVVVITKDAIELKTYGQLNKYIWKSQVIDRDIVIEQDIEIENVEYFQFVKRISADDPERFIYALSLCGYLLHKYKDPGRPYSVILAEETENESTGGGTGKGIFVKALGFINNMVRVDGKNFKIDKNFAFQRVDLDTKILAIEDTRKNVDFEGFYSIITEGITVEKKNKDELFIPYKDSPKVVFTTNYTIPNNGNHAKRRQRVFEFAPYFGMSRTPEDEFGHKLFDDWDDDEWNRFYNLMFDAIQGYLQYGIQEVPHSEKLAKKQVRVQFGEEFLDYFYGLGDFAEDWTSFEHLYNEFLKMSGYEKKDYSVKRFSKALEETASIMKIDHETKRDRTTGNKKLYKFKFKKDGPEPVL